jgi:hypothetical protein
MDRIATIALAFLSGMASHAADEAKARPKKPGVVFLGLAVTPTISRPPFKARIRAIGGRRIRLEHETKDVRWSIRGELTEIRDGRLTGRLSIRWRARDGKSGDANVAIDVPTDGKMVRIEDEKSKHVIEVFARTVGKQKRKRDVTEAQKIDKNDARCYPIWGFLTALRRGDTRLYRRSFAPPADSELSTGPKAELAHFRGLWAIEHKKTRPRDCIIQFGEEKDDRLPYAVMLKDGTPVDFPYLVKGTLVRQKKAWVIARDLE